MPNQEPPRVPSPGIDKYIKRNMKAWEQGYEGEAERNTWGYNLYYMELLKEDQTYNNYAWESMKDNWDEESS